MSSVHKPGRDVDLRHADARFHHIDPLTVMPEGSMPSATLRTMTVLLLALTLVSDLRDFFVLRESGFFFASFSKPHHRPRTTRTRLR